MAAVNVGTSTYSHATESSNQRKIVKTSEGKLVLFFNTGSIPYIIYKTSIDNGVTWSDSIEAFSPYATTFDVYIDTNNDILLVTSGGSMESPKFRKLTYNSGNWTNGTIYTIIAEAGVYIPTITRRSNGDLWFSANKSTIIYAFQSTNEGQNWIYKGINVGAEVYETKIISVGNDIWVFCQANEKITRYIYTTSWGTSADVATGITNATNSLAIVKISDSEIYATGRTSSGIKVSKWDGSSWDGGTLLTDNASDQSPALSNINNNPVLFWRDYTGTQYDIAYRVWDGSEWKPQINLTNDAAVDDYPSSIDKDSSTFYVCWTTGTSDPYTIYFDKYAPPIQKTITSDAKIKVLNIPKTISSDACITISIRKTILSDAKIKVLNIPKTILSNAKIVDLYQKTIFSDAHIKAIGIPQTITSTAKIIAQVLYDITNKIKIAKQSLIDVVSDFRFVKRVLSDVDNLFVMVKAIFKDIDNEFRMKKGKLYNINNDVRFIKSWQKAGEFGFQSLGKEYIHVYFNGIETYSEEINVDSIRIDKVLNGTHTASFDLGKPYDSSKPAIESLVEIRYYQKNEIDYWTLYKGYITEISPAENPESITIRCQDKYWLDNRTNKYFFVGHKPRDDREKYYSTIKEAISAEYDLNLNIGNFVPQTIDCFAQGKSDVLTSLISESGNYVWFYDIDDSFKLWKAGEGSIINIQRQEIGKNIGLYQLIEHRFNEDVSGVINKLRVQMGEKVIRKFNTTGGSRTYTGYNYSSFQGFLTPAWNTSYERLAKYSSDGYGWDYPEPGYEKEFGEVFKKFNIPYLDQKLSSWSDRFPPRIEIHSPGGYFYVAIGTITEGFTIDFENRIITFNEPQYLYRLNQLGQMTSVRAPTLKLFLWKKNYYTYTSAPSDNPEEDISNPLMFFTDPLGYQGENYPIIKDLNLSSLSIQEGGTYVDENGEIQVIPTWDDTDFAKDYARWQLSKICDKKIDGSILLTLDAVCFYGVDLSKRIYIDGITEEPLNIVSMSYNLSNFTVNIELQNLRGYRREISLQSRGE